MVSETTTEATLLRSREHAVRAARGAMTPGVGVEAQREQLRDFTGIEVIRAPVAYHAPFQSVRDAMRQPEAAEEAYAAKRRGFEVGIFDATEVIHAEVDVKRTRLALIDAAAGLRVRQSALRTAMGEHLWD